MDATLDRYNGTFQLVYLENVLEKALETPTIGVASGGWVDYIPDWH